MAIVSVMIIVIPMFALFTPTARAAGQPPIDTSKYWEGSIAWGPRRADPARGYDTGSGQLTFNVYETLVAPDYEDYAHSKAVLATSVATRTTVSVTALHAVGFDPANPVGASFVGGGHTYVVIGYADTDGSGTVTNGDSIWFNMDATEMRSWQITSLTGSTDMNAERYVYVWSIRTGAGIKFYDETGAFVADFVTDDVVYSLQRGLVLDQPGSPQWMFYKMFFGSMNSDPWNVDSATRLQLAKMISKAIEKTGPSEVTMSLGMNFPDAAYMQTVGNTWGSILSKSFSITNLPEWNGDLLTLNATTGDPAWWNSIRRIVRTGYDIVDHFRYVGTGPYYVKVFSQLTNQVIMARNLNWWQGWPYHGNGNEYSPGYVDLYEIDYISSWPARRDAFTSGSLDVCNVPRAYMFQLLSNTTKEPDPAISPYIKTIKAITPQLVMDADHFCFVLANASSPYIYSGHYPDGIPLTFFNDTHVRKAFAYAFNWSQYTAESYFGEANYRKNVFILGLVPDYYNSLVPGYDKNLAAAKAELIAAGVWNQGFKLALLYNEGNDQRRIACEMISAFFNTLSSYDGRVGSPFTVEISTVDWPTYLTLFEAQELPIFNIGWAADFADADNFVRPYMHSNGDFSYFQAYTADNGWGASGKDAKIDTAFITADGPARAALYNQLQQIYYDEVPSFPLTIPQGRRWCQYWVKGWYFDALYPAFYMPGIYKYDDCWYDVAGPGLPTRPRVDVQDGIINMRDISYLILHYGAIAPIPGGIADPKWVGTYGNGGVDTLGDRKCNMRDIAFTILHFNHKNNTLTP
jgi:peptide/nickel transport system substrate-binding protein